MDENLVWKIVYIAAIFSLIVLGAKIAEFKATRISGRKEGRKVWEFYAEEGWTAKDREITYLYNVKDGKIYQGKKLAVKDLTAPRVKAYRHSEIVEVFGSHEGKESEASLLSAFIEEREEWTKITADFLKYIPSEKRSEIQGNVRLYKKDSSISAQKIRFDHEKKTANISGDIQLKRKDGILRADSMNYFSDDERIEAEGHVNLKITEGRLKTEIKARRASFFSDISKDMFIQGSLEALQGKKLAIAQEGFYSQKNKKLTMRGNARTIFEKGRAILKEETVQTLKNPEAKKILKEKTILTCDELIFSTQTGDASASGSVLVSQNEREAKAHRAVYNDKDEILTLTGNVFMKKESEWISAKQVTVSIRDETFEAVGAVEAEFKL
jgi:lipopolysaccharide assembly outer membrane protein LptD (OstA)